MLTNQSMGALQLYNFRWAHCQLEFDERLPQKLAVAKLTFRMRKTARASRRHPAVRKNAVTGSRKTSL
jgi:hypothetical protein